MVEIYYSCVNIAVRKPAATGGMLAGALRRARAQNKPEKLVYIGENQGGWKRTLVRRLPGWPSRKPTGIRVGSLSSWSMHGPRGSRPSSARGRSGIDIAEWSVQYGRLHGAAHLLDHEPLLATIAKECTGLQFRRFPWRQKQACEVTTSGWLAFPTGSPPVYCTIRSRSLTRGRALLNRTDTFAEFEKAALAGRHAARSVCVRVDGRQGPGSHSSFASWPSGSGGKLADFKTGEVFINDAQGGDRAQQFYVSFWRRSTKSCRPRP